MFRCGHLLNILYYVDHTVVKGEVGLNEYACTLVRKVLCDESQPLNTKQL